MGLLHQIAVRAKSDGVYTLEWTVLRRFIPDELRLQDAPGINDIQKLETWAERQGLLLDLEMDPSGFINEIRTVTFWNRATRHLVQSFR